MALDTDTVRRIAHLARLKVPDDQLDHLAGEMSQILTFVEQLAAVDTTDVPPMTGMDTQKLRRRPDVVTDGQVPDKVLANAPDATGGFYSVPKVVE